MDLNAHMYIMNKAAAVEMHPIHEWGMRHMGYTINFMGRGWKIALEEGRFLSSCHRRV